MRITSKIIQNNSLSNINTNKILQDKLNNQMSTEKKINRPSDDPVIAIRALRLRTNVSQVTQYYEKNIPDADSWMKITEDAITTVSSVITDMIEQCTKGANEKLTSTDRQTILDELTQLRDEVYATGNADYAGRCVFTGYHTDDTLKFTDKSTAKYAITEQLNKSVIDEITYIETGSLNDINTTNYTTDTTTEQSISSTSLYRMQLAYDNVDGTAPTINLYNDTTKKYDTAITATAKSKYFTPPAKSPYTEVGDNDVILIEETGELLLGKNIYNQMMQTKDDPSTSNVDEGEIRVTYEKSDWKKNDLKPEHYFACVDNTDATTPINYNQDYLNGIVEKQSIEYDVGLNQAIRVNTTADEVFKHSIGRDVDDLIASMQEVVDMEKTVSTLENIKKTATGADLTTVNTQLDATNKALTLLKEKSQKLFEGGITQMQDHLNDVNYATTNCGTRRKKLELIQNRLMSQKTNFETLQSDNENADLTDVAIQLSGAELTYEAALMATGKILQSSLMNYI